MVAQIVSHQQSPDLAEEDLLHARCPRKKERVSVARRAECAASTARID
jgi:hypothetical protein